VIEMASFLSPNEDGSWEEVEFFLNLSTNKILIFHIRSVDEVFIERETDVS